MAQDRWLASLTDVAGFRATGPIRSVSPAGREVLCVALRRAPVEQEVLVSREVQAAPANQLLVFRPRFDPSDQFCELLQLGQEFIALLDRSPVHAVKNAG